MAGFWREVSKRFTRSSKWKEVRLQRLNVDGYKCKACGCQRNLQVHHIIPFHLDPDLELLLNNLITLCGRCHKLIGHLDNWKSYNEQVVYDSSKIRTRIDMRP